MHVRLKIFEIRNRSICLFYLQFFVALNSYITWFHSTRVKSSWICSARRLCSGGVNYRNPEYLASVIIVRKKEKEKSNAAKWFRGITLFSNSIAACLAHSSFAMLSEAKHLARGSCQVLMRDASVLMTASVWSHVEGCPYRLMRAMGMCSCSRYLATVRRATL